MTSIVYKLQNNDSCAVECLMCKVSMNGILAVCMVHKDVCNIFICDVVTPWEQHILCTTSKQISIMEWSKAGNYLLLGYKGGLIEVWATNKSIISWYIAYRSLFASEDIINAKFFYDGKSILFSTQKKDCVYYSDKFDLLLDRRPSLNGFGQTALEGYIVLTVSGLVGVVIFTRKESKFHKKDLPIVESRSITPFRKYITGSNISYNYFGGFNIAITNNSKYSIIDCFNVRLKMELGVIKIDICTYPSIVLFSSKVTHLKWRGDEMYVILDYHGGSCIEQWKLKKSKQGIHSLLQKSTTDCKETQYWEKIFMVPFKTKVSEICISKLEWDVNHIFITLNDNSVQIFDINLKKIGQSSFEKAMDEQQNGCRFIASDVSYLNQILFVFDNYGQLYALQVSNFEKCSKINYVSYIVTFLEYCIVSGTDPAEILMLNPSNLDMVIERLTDNFTRQPVHSRQFYYSNFLSIKSNICRCQSKQRDFDDLIILHAISITFKSLLRPSDLACQDKGPADNLSIILSDPISDVDKVLLSLDAKDFTVEPLTLQSLQPTVQWVTDLALNIFKNLPDDVLKSKLHRKQGYDIARDNIAIGTIRELLVLIRIWGLLNSLCLPMYIKSVESVDILSILFRLLTRLVQTTHEPDEILLDECSILSTQVIIPARRCRFPTSILNNTSPKSLPMIFRKDFEPMTLQDAQLLETQFLKGTKDHVCNLYIGCNVDVIKKCVRCGFMKCVQKTAKTSALKSWYNRWIHCYCGGFWKIM